MKIGKYEIYKYPLKPIDSNMYAFIDDDKALIIDPNENGEIIKLLEENRCTKLTVLLTHEHFDHICGVNLLREYADNNNGMCKVYAQQLCAEALQNSDDNLARFFTALYITHPEEERALAEAVFKPGYTCFADVSFEDNYEINWAELKLILKCTPGHSPGSICIEIYDEKDSLLAVATGDSLILDTPVITRLPRGSKSDYKEKTRPYLKDIPLDTLILPGHGEAAIMEKFDF